MKHWADFVFLAGLVIAAIAVFGFCVYTAYHDNELDQEEDDE